MTTIDSGSFKNVKKSRLAMREGSNAPANTKTEGDQLVQLQRLSQEELVNIKSQNETQLRLLKAKLSHTLDYHSYQIYHGERERRKRTVFLADQELGRRKAVARDVAIEKRNRRQNETWEREFIAEAKRSLPPGLFAAIVEATNERTG